MVWEAVYPPYGVGSEKKYSVNVHLLEDRCSLAVFGMAGGVSRRDPRENCENSY